MKTLIFALTGTLLLSACGQKAAGSKAAPSPAPLVTESKEPQVVHRPDPDAEIKGQFLAVLSTLNPAITENVTGAVTIAHDEDEFVGDVRFHGGPLTAGILHGQSVHEGGRCPTTADDTNMDGFIDAAEGEAVYGKVLIPLDGDLNAQHLELGTYPLADAYGGYIYSKVASFQKFLADLLEDDINPEDHFAKLDDPLALRFRGKVVIIQGISPAASLPETVASNTRYPNHATIPVACGVIEKVMETPGIVDRDMPKTPTLEEPGGVMGREDGTIIVPPPREI